MKSISKTAFFMLSIRRGLLGPLTPVLVVSLFMSIAAVGASDAQAQSKQRPPAKVQPQVVSLRSVNYKTMYLRHRLFHADLTTVTSDLDRKDSTFRMVPGLAGKGVSFESVNYPGRYLRHQLFRLVLHRKASDDLYLNDATFIKKPGLADPNGVSFESVNYPGYYLRHRGFQFWLDRATNSDLFRKDATFILTTANAPQYIPAP